MKLKVFFRTRVWISTMLALFCMLSQTLPGLADTSPSLGTELKTTNMEEQANSSKHLDPSYSEKLEQWKKEGASIDHNGSLTIPGAKLASQSANANISTGTYNVKNNVLIWSASKDEWIEYEVDVAQGGLYTIAMTYNPFVGTKYRKPIALNLTIDGSSPYLESKSVELYRQWKDKFPIRQDDKGDEIRPSAEDKSGWLTWELRDISGAYEDPLTWYLKPGKHRIRLSGSDPFALETITLKAPHQPDEYKKVRSEWPTDTPPVKSDPIKIEAEQMQWKNDSAITLAFDNDIASTPSVRGHITYNVVDGARWSSNNQEISWNFDVPETGYYKIAMRAEQSYVSNRSSFRQIMINGKIPFNELKAYRFMYATGWKSITLADEHNNPYEFYLEKGSNTISMRATWAPLGSVSSDLEQTISELSKLSEDLRTLTGNVDDKNRTWDLKNDLPSFIEQMQGVHDDLNGVRERMAAINGRPDAVTQALVTVQKDLEGLLKDPDEIPYNASILNRLQGKVAEQIKQLTYQPLQLDRIYVVPAQQPLPKMLPTFYEKLEGGLINFIDSFKSKRTTNKDDMVLDVWMLRGRDYVNMLQGLADEMFTPQTGIKVRVNLLKDEKLLVMMNAAGIAPDVALGLQQSIPFDYAIRGGVYNLKQFPDFDEYAKQFSPGTWPAFYYNGGYYAVPETQEFRAMYYRKDILKRLDLKVPDTWDDLYKMLPVLQQNGMNFTPVNDHGIFLQMHGAEYYLQDGSKTGLSSEKSLNAFKQWTELQNKYAIDQQMDSFYQHFKDGSYPLGIADLNTYLQLNVAAPELNGLWGVAPVPGERQEDGSVARWMGGNMYSSMIMKNAKHPNESWEFLKWWTSADVQSRFGTELETLYGVTFRWFTSNMEAFTQLPWKEDDLQAILEQWKWYREVPNVPGGSYLMEREMKNAWNRTVIDGMNYRTSLELAVKEVDREVKRKLQEFKFIDENGKLVRSLDLPVITKPWEGVDKYVKK
ncbi:extracellular solute-binding protein [Paenibacillus sp. Soil766]|uniref:extracellular solute-binding protein n=1 Tax=Paenibacillus sp. Soil766 TaxID=1736404 RepID=UPI0009E7E65C|nr:extracellular solute-binding protein [Paenibacillus sp. Soil766]